MRPCGKQTFTCEPVETITATKIIDITKIWLTTDYAHVVEFVIIYQPTKIHV